MIVFVCFFSNAGYATWHCSGHPAKWVPESGPDLTECVSIKLQNITDQVSSQTYQLEYLYICLQDYAVERPLHMTKSWQNISHYRPILITKKNRDMKTCDVSHCVSSLLRKLAMLAPTKKWLSFWKNCACPVYSFNHSQRRCRYTLQYSTYSCTVYELRYGRSHV